MPVHSKQKQKKRPGYTHYTEYFNPPSSPPTTNKKGKDDGSTKPQRKFVDWRVWNLLKPQQPKFPWMFVILVVAALGFGALLIFMK